MQQELQFSPKETEFTSARDAGRHQLDDVGACLIVAVAAKISCSG